MEARGALIYARLVVKHSYRAGHHFEDCSFFDIVGGENHGDNEIHLHFERKPQRDRHERQRERERYERLRERYERLRERYQHERERRQCERRQRKRERRHNKKLSRKVRHLERRVATLSAIVLGTA
jgi:hypothetical protein